MKRSDHVLAAGELPVPRLSDLPPPPPGRTGWPWTEEAALLETAMSNSRPWPRITIVTPSFAQGEFLEETIRSVLLQGYPDLEYIVIDGGSRDGSVEIIQKYAPWLSYWCSEPDRGQSHAINKGLSRSSGGVQAWLNSDDTYCAGALAEAVLTLEASHADILIGAMEKFSGQGEAVRILKRSSPNRGKPLHPFRLLADGRRPEFHFIQPPMFWRADVWRRTGGLDERYHYVMDAEWCSRAFGAGARVATTESVLARFRVHAAAKTHAVGSAQLMEHAWMYFRLGDRPGFSRINCTVASLAPAARALIAVGAKWSARGARVRGRVFRVAGVCLGWLYRSMRTVLGPRLAYERWAQPTNRATDRSEEFCWEKE